jgi:integrase
MIVAVKKQKNQQNRGVVSVSLDKGYLRLQFPTEVSQKVWGKRQKYLSLGLVDSPENRAKANELAAKAQLDILSNTLDDTLQKYKPYNDLEEILPTPQKVFPSLRELYDKYCEDVKTGMHPLTFKRYYRYSHLRTIDLCGEFDIRDGLKIRDVINANRSKIVTRRTLDLLYNVFEWAIVNELISPDTPNPYRKLKQGVKGSCRQKKPKHLAGLIEEPDDDYRGFEPEEVREIIEGFAERGYPRGRYYAPIKFLFWTGCRQGECAGLRWKDVSEDCRQIIFRNSLERGTKQLKCLKTEKVGGKKVTRTFPCGEKLQQLLLSIRPEDFKPDDFVFGGDKPLNMVAFGKVWAGYEGRQGVIEKLIKSKKVSQYLKMYATRHTFITYQLRNGMQPADVAKLVGNSPETIYTYYVSPSRNFQMAPEI